VTPKQTFGRGAERKTDNFNSLQDNEERREDAGPKRRKGGKPGPRGRRWSQLAL